MNDSTDNKNDCYCSLWDTDPEVLIEQGVPRGYCGLCEVETKGKKCGKPGHIRQGDGPYSFCCCDEHDPGDAFTFNPVRLGCNLAAGLGFLFIVWLLYTIIF